MHVTPDTNQKLRGLFIVVVPLLGFLAAVILLWNRYVFASDLILLGVLYVVLSLGITIGYHRMLTHDGFKAPDWIRALFLIAGAMAWEGAPIMWASTHVKHHAHSDEEDDPHTPLHGFWYAHCGWLFGKQNFPSPEVYAPHLLKDPLVVFINRYTLLWMALALVIPFAIGGWTGLVWGGFVRIFLTTHITWSVNSICHTFGKRAFETTDESRNEWIIGVLGLGEGWHNNHHAFPRNAFHGMRWWQFDLSGIVIRSLEILGLAREVQRVSPETVEAHRVRTMSGREVLQQMRRQVLESAVAAQREMEAALEHLTLDAAIGPDKAAALRDVLERSKARMLAIQHYLGRASHPKAPKLKRYQTEIAQATEGIRALWRQASLRKA